jgi:hypothetical protein
MVSFRPNAAPKIHADDFFVVISGRFQLVRSIRSSKLSRRLKLICLSSLVSQGSDEEGGWRRRNSAYRQRRDVRQQPYRYEALGRLRARPSLPIRVPLPRLDLRCRSPRRLATTDRQQPILGRFGTYLVLCSSGTFGLTRALSSPPTHTARSLAADQEPARRSSVEALQVTPALPVTRKAASTRHGTRSSSNCPRLSPPNLSAQPRLPLASLTLIGPLPPTSRPSLTMTAPTAPEEPIPSPPPLNQPTTTTPGTPKDTTATSSNERRSSPTPEASTRHPWSRLPSSRKASSTRNQNRCPRRHRE